MKWLWATGLILTLAASANAVSWENFVVKISSRLCLGGTPFLGSGVLFSESGKSYVLTSDHVELHLPPSRNDLATYCQTSTTSDWAPIDFNT